MIFLAAAFAALAVFSGARVLVRHPVSATEGRLEQIRSDRESDGHIPSETDSSLRERMLQPLSQWLSAQMARIMPAGVVRRFDQQLLVAGRPMSTQAFLALLGGGPLVGVALAVELIVQHPPSSSMSLLYLACGPFVGGALPVYWLSGRVRRRQTQLGKELPDTLDLIVVSVEAGLSFEAAMARVTDDSHDLLSLELRRVLGEMNLGTSRRAALQGLVARTRVPAINSLVSAIVQAEQTGMGIAQVLRAQSAYLRGQRKQRAEEAAMKAPLKMLFPLIFFIFPSLFVVILGPAGINLMHGFAK